MKKSKKTIKKYTKLVLVVVVIIVGLSFISSTTKAQSGQCTGTITASCGQLGAFGCGFAGCTWTGPFIGGTCSGGTPPNDCSAFPTETFCGYGPGCSWASGGGWNPPVVTFLQDPTGSYLSPINEGPTPQYKQGFFEIGGNLVVDGGGETFLGQVSTVFGNAFFDGPVYVDNFRGEQDVTIREDLSADFVNTKNDVLIADTLIAGGGIEISSVSGSGDFVCSDEFGKLYRCGPPDAIRPGGWVAWNTTGYTLTSGGAQDCSDFDYCRRESATVSAGFGSFTTYWGEFEIVDALGLVRVYAIGGGGGGGGGGTGCGGQGKGGSGGGGGGGGEIRAFEFNSAYESYKGKTLLIRIGRGAIGGHGGVYASCGQNNRYHGGDDEHNNHTTTFYKNESDTQRARDGVSGLAGSYSRVRFFKDPSLIPHPFANNPSEYSGDSIIKAIGGSGGQFGGGKSIYGGGGGGGSGGSCIDQPTCNTLPGGRGGNGLNSDLTSDCHDDCGGSGGGGGSLNGAVGANGTDVQGISLSGVISNIRFPGTGLGIPRGAERRPMTPTNNVGYGGRAGIGPGAGAGGGSGGGNVGNHTGGSGGDGTDGAVIICWAGASGSFSHCPVTRSGVVWP